mmetsp:Transcript_33362/g.44233  ORF Transcript_33362/g.44233 Transcript_33362/m.44233 type:complete len:465 (-) Transcript_33362:351-1745(-)
MYRFGIATIKSTTKKQSNRCNVVSTAATRSIKQQSQQQQQRCFSSSPLILRKTVSPSERAALRAARKEKAARVLQSVGGNASKEGAAAAATSSASAASPMVKFDVTRLTWYIGLGLPTLLIGWGIYDDESPPAKFADMIGLKGLIGSITEEYARPMNNKLLPDWNQIPNVPPDMPCPHTLVLDLENTLVSATWDRKHGWRHAKRPGVDKFLQEMAQYYEIVLYSPSIEGVAQPVVVSLDKQGCILHQLYRESTYYMNGVHVKDLNSLNRNTNRIIVLDDSPEEVQLNPENLIRVKPYDDPNNRDDDTLSRITPFLIECATENYDVPTVLRQFKGMDADGIADEHERRIASYKAEREAMSMRGLGSLSSRKGFGALSIRKRGDLPAPELPPEAPKPAGATQPITSKDLVKDGPQIEQQHGVVGWLSKRQKENAEEQMRKMEKWNEVMMKRQQEKKEKEMQQTGSV